MTQKSKHWSIIESSDAAKEIIGEAIVEYNRKNVPFSQSEDFIPLNYHICNDEGVIIAGLIAIMYCWKVIYIDVLFVDENHRKQGLGSTLLKHIEEMAEREGASLIHLDTFDWQAKDFYIKHGFEVFGVLDDCPPGHKRYYIKKTL
jgi:GNAT superfamily N-acetyltransferase